MIQIIFIAVISLFFIVACATQKEKTVEIQKTNELKEFPISKDLKPMYLGGTQLEKTRNENAKSKTKTTSQESP